MAIEQMTDEEMIAALEDAGRGAGSMITGTVALPKEDGGGHHIYHRRDGVWVYDHTVHLRN
jgi:hypothetical protein